MALVPTSSVHSIHGLFVWRFDLITIEVTGEGFVCEKFLWHGLTLLVVHACRFISGGVYDCAVKQSVTVDRLVGVTFLEEINIDKLMRSNVRVNILGATSDEFILVTVLSFKVLDSHLGWGSV